MQGNYTGRTARSLVDAFGPYTSNDLHGPDRKLRIQLRTPPKQIGVFARLQLRVTLWALALLAPKGKS